jgi:polar amino acid transport system substrate-binding protein
MGKWCPVMVARSWKLKKTRYAFGTAIAVAVAIVILLQYSGLKRRKDKPAFPYNELRIAVDANYAPFALHADEVLEGIDIDVGQALGDALNLPVRFVNTSRDGLYDALITDQADIIISAIAMDTWRLHQVRYTQPYFDAGLVLISETLTRMDDLPGHSLAYEFGSNADSEVRRWQRRIDAFGTQPYELPDHALDAVRLGLADAALVGMVDARLYLNDYPEWQIEPQYVTHLQYVIAIRIDRKATFARIQGALDTLHDDGTTTSIIEDWL